MSARSIHTNTASSSGIEEVCETVQDILEEAFMFCKYERRISAITNRINNIIDSKIEEYLFRERRLSHLVDDVLMSQNEQIGIAIKDSVQSWLDEQLADYVDEMMNDYVESMTDELKKDVNLSRLAFLEASSRLKRRMHELDHVKEELRQLRVEVEEMRRKM